MSLQVWLPLAGSLVNQGLSTAAVTNTGATVDNSGKIGSCYSFTTSKLIQSALTNPITSVVNSMACWVKFNSFPGSGQYLCLLKVGGVGSGYGAGVLCLWLENGMMYVTIKGSDPAAADKVAHPFTTGIWYHLAATYDGTTAKIYSNGTEIYSKTLTKSGTLTTISCFLVGASNAGTIASPSPNYGLNGLVNDARFYDHCLSVKEVRELSKALVLHYKLDDPYVEGTTNYLTAAGSCANWRNYTASTWATSIDSTCAIGNYVITYSAYIKNNTNVSVRVRCSPLYVAGSYGTVYGNWIAPGGQGWSSVTCDISNSDTYTGSFYPYVATSIAGTIPDMPNFQVLHAQAERKDHRTAWTLGGTTRAAATLVYDSSGYKYNGTPTNVETSTPSVRYSMCSSFNGTDSRIVVPYNAACPTNIFTLNLWWKKDALGSKGYETLFGGPSGFEMDTRAGSATTLCLYMASTRGGTLYSPLSLGQWYMFTLVRDGTNEFYYIDGALVKTIEAKSMPTGTYFIGAWSSATSQNYYGKIADFRLYNTPLSAADVLDLYRTEAAVDRNSAVHAREVVEL